MAMLFKASPEIRAAGRAAFRDSERLNILFEQWATCEGVWTESHLYLQMTQTKRQRKRGARA